MFEKIVIAVVAAVITGFFTWLAKLILAQGKKINLLMVAQQQILRNALMNISYMASRWDCISDDDAELFEAMYNAYHNLGQNGVMTSRHEEIMNLRKVPYYGYIEKEEKKGNNHK